MAATGKLTIYGHEKDITQPNAGAAKETFTAQINPENLSHSRSIAFNDDNTAHTPTSDQNQIQGYNSDSLSFDLILDGTGLTGDDSVMEQINKLSDTCYTFDGESHKPLYLWVIYGGLEFKGHLEDMSSEYNLFDSDGFVLRAKVSLKFKGYKHPETEARENNSNSPDMSHMKVIREGDSLPSMCQDIYGDIKYYIAIARINKLTNFREIEVGTELLFPPLI